MGVVKHLLEALLPGEHGFNPLCGSILDKM
jgi:hypothetical protein